MAVLVFDFYETFSHWAIPSGLRITSELPWRQHVSSSGYWGDRRNQPSGDRTSEQRVVSLLNSHYFQLRSLVSQDTLPESLIGLEPFVILIRVRTSRHDR